MIYKITFIYFLFCSNLCVAQSIESLQKSFDQYSADIKDLSSKVILKITFEDKLTIHNNKENSTIQTIIRSGSGYISDPSATFYNLEWEETINDSENKKVNSSSQESSYNGEVLIQRITDGTSDFYEVYGEPQKLNTLLNTMVGRQAIISESQIGKLSIKDVIALKDNSDWSVGEKKVDGIDGSVIVLTSKQEFGDDSKLVSAEAQYLFGLPNKDNQVNYCSLRNIFSFSGRDEDSINEKTLHIKSFQTLVVSGGEITLPKSFVYKHSNSKILNLHEVELSYEFEDKSKKHSDSSFFKLKFENDKMINDKRYGTSYKAGASLDKIEESAESLNK